MSEEVPKPKGFEMPAFMEQAATDLCSALIEKGIYNVPDFDDNQVEIIITFITGGITADNLVALLADLPKHPVTYDYQAPYGEIIIRPQLQ